MEEIQILDANIGSGVPIRFSHMRTAVVPDRSTYHMHDCLEIYIFVSGDVDFLVGNTC